MFLCIFASDMMLFQNPIVWLYRFRKRKGYGVHSPFAFNFVTDVLYNSNRYYAYEEMDRDLRWWQKGRVCSVRHLLFRLANYRQPRTLYCKGMCNALQEAVNYGAKCLETRDVADEAVVDMILAEGGDMEALCHVGEGTMMVVRNIHHHRAYWKRVKEDARITITFDLYDLGIAFARKDLNRQHYIINW